jgi:hypothetical protein
MLFHKNKEMAKHFCFVAIVNLMIIFVYILLLFYS